MKKGEIKQDTRGKTYVLEKKLGRGGQATVWKVRCQEDGKFYAYKEHRHNKYGIRTYIEALIDKSPLRDKNGDVLTDMIPPLSIVNGSGDSFGYVMELVNLDDYTTLPKAWIKNYPSCQAICRLMQKFADIIHTLHNSYGMCYKDVNEGNVFFNPDTGDLRLIDNDNVGYSSHFTVRGTVQYMAPEVVFGTNPDTRSDLFSFAVFAYRLLVGGYPFEGPFTVKYCEGHNLLPNELEAAKAIYQTGVPFVWHPTDRRNSIERHSDEEYRLQTTYWKRLPQSVRDLFIKTFVTNLSEDRRAERAGTDEWKDVFKKLETELTTCPKCGKKTFGGMRQCFLCGAALPARSSVKPSVSPGAHTPPYTGTTSHTGTTSTTGHEVTFTILSRGEKKRNAHFHVADKVRGEEISKNLENGPLFQVLYNKKAAKIGVKNLSASSWTVIRSDKTETVCNPGNVLALEDGMQIRLIYKVAHLNVTKLV